MTSVATEVLVRVDTLDSDLRLWGPHRHLYLDTQT